ncbi:hypothetical protein ACVNF4_26480, partial [Streptomyces sp. S6]
MSETQRTKGSWPTEETGGPSRGGSGLGASSADDSVAGRPDAHDTDRAADAVDPASAAPRSPEPPTHASRTPAKGAAQPGGELPNGLRVPVPEASRSPEEPVHAPDVPPPPRNHPRRFPSPTTLLRLSSHPPKRPAPLALQINALQAMSRQVFGFRLAMIALAAPAALLHAAPGVGVRLVGTAVVVTFMVSYALLRDWEKFGPLLLRHPSLLAVDTLLGSLLLVSAGPDTTLAYVSVCTPLLAGIVYGWRGAAFFASAQGLILLLVYTTLHARSGASVAERLLLPGFCVITGALGSALRGLMLRFGEATEALAETRARLAAAEAVAAERA